MKSKSLSFEEERRWFFKRLMQRPCTKFEAARLLRERGGAEPTVEKLIGEALDLQLLDDAAYARLFAEGHRNWGKNREAFELRRRGVSDEDIQAALADIDEQERAEELVDAWRESGLEKRKIASRLYRRGFSGRTISIVCQDESEVSF